MMRACEFLFQICIEFPDEYVIGVSGHIGLVNSQNVVKSLTLTTNTQTFGPFGDENSTQFSLPIEEGRIVSFFGRSGVYLDAIGFRIRA